MDLKKKTKIIYDAIDEKLGIDIKILDVSDITVIADYLIIASGNNKSQVQAIVDNVSEKLAKEDIHAGHTEGYNSANWVLLDYNDVIVHIFNQEDRFFYDLERLWIDGKEVTLD